MGDLSEFSFVTRAFLKAYPWRRIDPVSWTPLRKPLVEANVALVTTAGLVMPDQAPFDDKIKGGDSSYRVIPGDADVSSLIDTHRSETFDHSGIQSDPNLAFPLDRLHELARDGRIGRVNERHLSFMGSITAPGRLIRDTAPAVARLLVQDAVDVVLLVPV
ncbi:MAG TPA: glycine/sarcosine/betaine reductase selenoprotein B family protein [Thermoanaerobaculia bacterium]|jgi:D-proline reductase (dithiol) PrdB|nr:glycine/sarcosine/betaine reductase selenoprotein B family protein [Thermoanaerobaculia bacterium]